MVAVRPLATACASLVLLLCLHGSIAISTQEKDSIAVSATDAQVSASAQVPAPTITSQQQSVVPASMTASTLSASTIGSVAQASTVSSHTVPLASTISGASSQQSSASGSSRRWGSGSRRNRRRRPNRPFRGSRGNSTRPIGVPGTVNINMAAPSTLNLNVASGAPGAVVAGQQQLGIADGKVQHQGNTNFLINGRGGLGGLLGLNNQGSSSSGSQSADSSQQQGGAPGALRTNDLGLPPISQMNANAVAHNHNQHGAGGGAIPHININAEPLPGLGGWGRGGLGGGGVAPAPSGAGTGPLVMRNGNNIHSVHIEGPADPATLAAVVNPQPAAPKPQPQPQQIAAESTLPSQIPAQSTTDIHTVSVEDLQKQAHERYINIMTEATQKAQQEAEQKAANVKLVKVMLDDNDNKVKRQKKDGEKYLIRLKNEASHKKLAEEAQKASEQKQKQLYAFLFKRRQEQNMKQGVYGKQKASEHDPIDDAELKKHKEEEKEKQTLLKSLREQYAAKQAKEKEEESQKNAQSSSESTSKQSSLGSGPTFESLSSSSSEAVEIPQPGSSDLFSSSSSAGPIPPPPPPPPPSAGSSSSAALASSAMMPASMSSVMSSMMSSTSGGSSKLGADGVINTGSSSFKPKKNNKLLSAAEIKKTGEFTYMFWIKLESLADDWTQLLHKGADKRQRNPAVFVLPKTGRLHVRSGTSKGWNTGLNTDAALPQGKWAHFALTHDGSGMKVYIDGSLANSRKLPAPKENDGDLWACGPWYDGTNALMSDIRYLPKAVPLSEIKKVMALNKHD